MTLLAKSDRNVRATLLLLFSMTLLLAGCNNLTLSKEQRQLNDAIKEAVVTDPSRINAAYRDGEPPLHLALSSHLPALFYWLLDRGADPNVRDQRGLTPLHEAVFFDSPDHRAIRALLDRGAVIDARGNDGETPLHLAAFLSHAATAERLLAAGADPNARSDLGKTPLHNASTPQPTASPEEATRTIHVLVAGGADLNAHTTAGDTPLHYAALIGSDLAARTLLGEGAQVDAAGAGGRTALHVAAAFAKAGIAEILLDAGADPNRRDDQGLTPLAVSLRYPAITGSAERTGPVDTSAVVEMLKQAGATD
jgi:ankyrin repeat protein